MKFSFTIIIIILIITSKYSVYAQQKDTISDSDAVTLEQRIADLKMRVATLEQLLTKSKTSEIQSTEKWNDRTLWRKLKTGMSMNQVEALLGSPKRISGGNSAHWYYSEESLYGIVVFDDGRVRRWEEPK
jgi:hypothetical protein